MNETMLRVGLGHDIHRLAPNRALILGGLRIDFERGLLGHSDADILLHAITDALLGAAGLGDIGDAFPDTDPAYAGIDSAVLLEKTLERVRSGGWRIVNLDCTIFAQRPKLAQHKPAIRQKLADLLAIPPRRSTSRPRPVSWSARSGAKKRWQPTQWCSSRKRVEKSKRSKGSTSSVPRKAASLFDPFDLSNTDIRTPLFNALPMPLRVYNTLTRQKEDFQTVVPGKVGMYLCGPTVYKPAHIGHMVGPVIFDSIKRYPSFTWGTT